LDVEDAVCRISLGEYRLLVTIVAAGSEKPEETSCHALRSGLTALAA